MRIPPLLVLAAVTSALVAGCAGTPSDDSATSTSTSTATSSRASSTATETTTTTTTTAAATRAPAAGAPIRDVVQWVEAGTPADPAGFHAVTRDGTSTELGDGIAFVTAGAALPTANCVTNRYRDGALACLVDLSSPPERPDGVEGMWKGNWVDFTGMTVEVGSAHGDPGPFGDGNGAELAAGRSLAFGDYRCRADADGLWCVNYAHQSGVHLAAAGVEAFGCLTEDAQPPAGIGRQYSC